MSQFTNKQEIEICESYKSGHAIRQLAIDYHSSVPTLKKILKKHSCSLRKKGDLLKHKYDATLIQRTIDLYNDGKGLTTICKTLNIPYSMARMFLIKSGIKMRNENDKIYKGNTTRARVEEINNLTPDIIRDYLNNMKWNDIIIKYQISDTTLQKILKDNNVTLRSRGLFSQKTFSSEQKEEIIKLYLNGVPAYKIGPKFDVSDNLVRRMLRKWGLKMRSAGFRSITYCKSSWGISGYYKEYYFRSMNEISFIINYLEKKDISFDSGEKTSGIRYFDSTLNKNRTYYPDFITDKYIFENKPKELWSTQETLDKAKAAKRFCSANNLEYRIMDYPVIIGPILEKYFNNEIKFSKSGSEKFCRIYKKYLN